MSAEANGQRGRGGSRRRPGADGLPRAGPGQAGRRLITPAIGVSLLLVAFSAAASFTWVLANGGVQLPERPGTGVAGATAGPSSPSAQPSLTAGGPPSASPVITAPPTSPPITPAPPTLPPPTAVPSPTSDRYALLVPCPDAPDCFVYTVRSGDNLWSIARYFGVSLDAVYERNPGIQLAPLRPGMPVILPPPTS